MSDTAISIEGPEPAAVRPGRATRWLRDAIHRRLEALEHGELRLVEADGSERRFGSATAAFPLRARVEVRDPAFYRRLARRGTLGAGEGYMAGEWGCDDLPALIRILMRNAASLESLDGRRSRLSLLASKAWHRLRRNSRARARDNIAAHYDLGNDFYELFLDRTLTYSAGIFEGPEASLEEASLAKYERICRKLALGPEDHVLEIGSGWGGFAIHAAGRHGCRVTTTTISREQWELASRRVEEAGLSDRVTVLLRDYRDLDGVYDKLVSIEMIEAVGHDYLDTFFRVCGERLAPDGLMLLQCISTPDRRYAESVRSVDFIKRYVFPGGQLVSLGAVVGSSARVADLRVEHVEDLSPHYAETLRRWRKRFLSRLDRVRALGFDERFLRLWDFYLGSCEGSFWERYVASQQILLAKPLARREPVLGRF